MNAYPNNIGAWEERDGIRTEVFHDGSWVVYTTGEPFISISSADGNRTKDIESAKRAAAIARTKLAA